MFLITIIFIYVVYLIWRFGTKNFDYWTKKGVKHEEPVFFFGNMSNQVKGRMTISQQIAEWYDKFPEEQYVGVHMVNSLGLVLRDPELIKHVLITDFQYFHQRGFHSHKTVREPLYQNIAIGDGDVWKLLRHRLTPAFSAGKIKAMFPIIQKMTDRMLAVTKEGTHDVKELMARYITDFIGVCGFGLDIDSLNDESAIFRRLGKRIMTLTTRDALAHLAKRVAPELFKHLNYFVPEIEESATFLVKQILNKRNYMPSGRNDFIDMLLELRQKGKMVGESLEHFNPDGTARIVELELDDTLITSQVMVFFVGGYETSSSGTSFLLHELAFAPEIQERCHTEINDIMSRYNGKITYEAVKEFKYLEMAFREALRLHPSPGYLIRKCGKKYTFPGTSLTIDEDVTVLVPLHSLHNDPKYFDDPETFRPERFDPDNYVSLPKCVYMPFGGGPRACIGERLALMQSLAGIAALLSKFRVEPAPNSRRRPVIDPRSFFMENVLGGLPLKLVRRETAYSNL